MSSRREARLASLYQKIISEWLERNLGLKGIIVAVTNVIISDDLGDLKIYFSVWPDQNEKDVLELLKNSKKELRGHLAEKVKAKFVPSLEFILDESEKQRIKIEQLLKKTK